MCVSWNNLQGSAACPSGNHNELHGFYTTAGRLATRKKTKTHLLCNGSNYAFYLCAERLGLRLMNVIKANICRFHGAVP
jgi:hypothetical protein